MDSLFLSPLQKNEIWDFQNVPQFHPAFLAFLTLRSFLVFESFGAPLQVRGLSRIWKTYLSKSGYFKKNSNLVTLEFIPDLLSLGEEEISHTEISFQDSWKYKMNWETTERDKKVVFFCASGRDQEKSASLSELLSQFLIDSQKANHLTRAYIRKETSSYLYLQSPDQVHPRVFFRENTKELSPFLLFIAELSPF
ncbi:hypothetical protein EHS15_14060 [Leptospira idonii]|uniref:Uncharacterized protein n=2 Tax=Leptospira idonii TaxID=1193500 RepID=A0A4R9LY39_9LEPT|nr:hypothetical protein [Leptospira idonii]TGN18511.1 hypothetical protein EHS15_14060 [Leptospira idonii]